MSQERKIAEQEKKKNELLRNRYENRVKEQSQLNRQRKMSIDQGQRYRQKNLKNERIVYHRRSVEENQRFLYQQRLAEQKKKADLNRNLKERLIIEEQQKRNAWPQTQFGNYQPKQELLHKFEKVLQISNRIKQTQAAKMLKLTEDELTMQLFEWSGKFPFKIEGDEIVVDDISLISKALDLQFEEWSEKEAAGIGKIEYKIDAVEEELVDYHGFSIIRSEYEFLRDLSKNENIDIFPVIREINKETFGIVLKKGQIIQLGLNGKNLKSIPDSIGNLTNLRYLDIGNNSLVKLPDSIAKLVHIEKLLLRRNKFSTLPEFICNFKKLILLSMNENQLVMLPEWISNLKNLQLLNLGKNLIKSLPKSIGNLTALKILSVDENNLNSLPQSVGNLSNLTFFNFRKNFITLHSENVEVALGKLVMQGCKVIY
jgi:Leucine-rich repeat (LRR) protein